MLEIGGLAGAIILAGGMDAQRIGEERAVMRQRARIEAVRSFALVQLAIL